MGKDRFDGPQFKGMIVPRIELVIEGLKAEVYSIVHAQTIIEKEQPEKYVDEAFLSFNLQAHVERIVHREMVKELEKTISKWRGPVMKKIRGFVDERLFEVAIMGTEKGDEKSG